MKAYPLKLTTPLATHIFGGQRIRQQLGKAGLPDSRVAETWEISDVDGMIASVTNGELAGTSLRELITRYPDDIVAPGWRGPHFPLLSKFIDGSGMLPVHLHADDEAAQRLEQQPNGKTEAWHILWAAPDATCLLGVRAGVDHARLKAALLAEDYDAVMHRVPVKTGDTFYVPGGMLHSFGPDTLIYEIEQTSDIQQHAMPWNMEDGSCLSQAEWEQNIDALLQELRPELRCEPQPGLTLNSADLTRRFCCASPYFALERWQFSQSQRFSFNSARILSNPGEPLRVEANGVSVEMGRAESLLLPAALDEVILHDAGDLLIGYVPDLADEVVTPLRQAGYSDRAIAALGEIPALAE
ncbi:MULTISPECIES: class I mannose-6-phosphate isomerase [Pantoea]|uniref:class I mannose-6-phosphate isomerase n=1 Tax=Pantoea TaxID=53335 RepID=UPI001F3E6040|nr:MULTISPECIES: class I mannose-6-phosphate isomerase [Pantoea]UIL53802.1 class I mannose-6-phosphate isomerase [Pantoea agglomerans]